MIERNFSSAHQLRGYRGKCENLHGHNYKIEIYARGRELDSIGLLVDFVELKAAADNFFKFEYAVCILPGVVSHSVAEPAEQVEVGGQQSECGVRERSKIRLGKWLWREDARARWSSAVLRPSSPAASR